MFRENIRSMMSVLKNYLPLSFSLTNSSSSNRCLSIIPYKTSTIIPFISPQRSICKTYWNSSSFQSEDDELKLKRTTFFSTKMFDEFCTNLRKIHILTCFNHPFLVSGSVSLLGGKSILLHEELSRLKFSDRRLMSLSKIPLIKYFEQTFNALSFLHKEGIVHGNVKGDSIYITKEGAKLGGFEKVKFREESFLRPQHDLFNLANTFLETITGIKNIGKRRKFTSKHGSNELFSLLCLVLEPISAERYSGLLYRMLNSEKETLYSIYSELPNSYSLENIGTFEYSSLNLELIKENKPFQKALEQFPSLAYEYDVHLKTYVLALLMAYKYANTNSYLSSLERIKACLFLASKFYGYETKDLEASFTQDNNSLKKIVFEIVERANGKMVTKIPRFVKCEETRPSKKEILKYMSILHEPSKYNLELSKMKSSSTTPSNIKDFGEIKIKDLPKLKDVSFVF